MAEFCCDLGSSPGELKHFWETCVGGGHAALALRADYQTQPATAQYGTKKSPRQRGRGRSSVVVLLRGIVRSRETTKIDCYPWIKYSAKEISAIPCYPTIGLSGSRRCGRNEWLKR